MPQYLKDNLYRERKRRRDHTRNLEDQTVTVDAGSAIPLAVGSPFTLSPRLCRVYQIRGYSRHLLSNQIIIIIF